VSYSVFLGFINCQLTRLLFPAGAGVIFLHHLVQTGAGVHQISSPLGALAKGAWSWSWPLTSI